MFDRLLKGGTVVDGTGAPRFRADVGLRRGKIAAVERAGIPSAAAAHVTDVSGLVVAPGFVDMHAHTDLLLLAEPSVPCKIRQGIVTEHLGQDGISVAPVHPEDRELTRAKLAGLLGRHDVEWSWSSVGEYLEVLRRVRPATQPVYAVPHGTLRAFVIGHGARPATDAELAALGAALDRALDEGAVGMSTGLIYPPCTYADRRELAALLGVLARRGSFLSIHLRSEGATTLEALEEILSIGAETGCAVNVSHIKIAGREHWPKLEAFLRVLEAYRARIPVTFDQYPYTAGSTLLTAALPPWVHDGGPASMLARLRDPETRARICRAIEDRADTSWENYLWLSGPEGLIVTDAAVPALAGSVGRSFAELAAARGTSVAESIVAHLDEAELGVTVLSHSQCEDVVETFMKLPYGLFCTDGIVGKKPHPRLYGTAPRVLGHYVRRRGVLSLEEAVRRLSSAAYDRLGLRGEGRVAPGAGAHLVCFDPNTIADRATYEDPRAYPVGISHVFVRGEPVYAS